MGIHTRCLRGTRENKEKKICRLLATTLQARDLFINVQSDHLFAVDSFSGHENFDIPSSKAYARCLRAAGINSFTLRRGTTAEGVKKMLDALCEARLPMDAGTLATRLNIEISYENGTKRLPIVTPFSSLSVWGNDIDLGNWRRIALDNGEVLTQTGPC